MARTTKTSKKAPKAPAKKLSAPKASKAAKISKAPKTAGSDFPEVRSLIDLLKQNDLAVLEFEKGDFRITLKTPAGASSGATVIQGHASAPAPATLPAASSAPAEKAAAPEPAKSNFKEITSPMVGTFYATPSPDAPPFVEAGKTINADSVVCIIEAMKVMNEIKAEISGKVVEVVAENGKPVQFGQVLFRVS
ncbi:MAG: acetyl-CoA carboxylase biotin carboxyl carrier protein [Chthoniobacterales bacterium]